jgi:hypothetical protein
MTIYTDTTIIACHVKCSREAYFKVQKIIRAQEGFFRNRTTTPTGLCNSNRRVDSK